MRVFLEAGSAGPFKGKKRLLTEGGIRVPAIAMWDGKLRAGSTSGIFSFVQNLFLTGFHFQALILLFVDSFMLTTDLFPTLLDANCIATPPHLRIDGLSVLPVLLSKDSFRHGDERTILWYTHSIGFPKLTAAWSHGDLT